eukprot:scaffold21331_cov117-Isochrysis_galbana.AAC.13
MALRALLLALVAQASGLKIGASHITHPAAVAGVGRRSALAGAAAAALLQLPLPAFAQTNEEKAQAQIRETSAALHKLLDHKKEFVAAYAEGKGDRFPVPSAVPFTVFQTLEKTAEPEFMAIAIDYAEASRGARDLIKLAKLTKQPVEVSIKETGKPRRTAVTEYGSAEGSGLSTAEEYAERAAAELLAASICLDEAIKVMVAK